MTKNVEEKTVQRENVAVDVGSGRSVRCGGHATSQDTQLRADSRAGYPGGGMIRVRMCSMEGRLHECPRWQGRLHECFRW